MFMSTQNTSIVIRNQSSDCHGEGVASYRLGQIRERLLGVLLIFYLAVGLIIQVCLLYEKSMNIDNSIVYFKNCHAGVI